jgi:hypothetical protein
MSLEVIIVGGNRFLINTESKGVDNTCEEILKHYPSDAVVEFATPTLADVKLKTLK